MTDTTDQQPPACCAAEPRIAAHFDQRIIELSEEAGSDFPEMVEVSATLLRLLEADAERAAPTVLELGCGSGALTVGLLKRGAARARGIDLSPGMLAVAHKRAEAAGVGDRVSFGQGNAAHASVEPFDWVVLDRVICCYPDMPRLLDTALAAARARVAFTVPTSRGWRGLLNRIMWPLENVPLRFGRAGCPGFVHSLDRIESRLTAAGFAQVHSDRLGLWHAAVWDRAPDGFAGARSADPPSVLPGQP